MTAIDDALPEGIEIVTLVLPTNANYVVGTGTATVKIVDDDMNVVALAASDATANENGDTGTFAFTRTGDTSAALTVFYGIGGTSMHGLDYQALSGFATFAAGSATTTATIIPINDSHGEPAQTVTLQLRSGINYQVSGTGNATVTITDDGDLPVVTVGASDGSATEGADNGSFLFTTTGTGTGNIAVRYAVSGRATSGSDYNALTGTLSMGKNNTAAVSVVPINDTALENAENVVVTILPDPAYTVDLQNSASVMIRDNDVANMVSVSTSSTAVSETLAGKFFFSRSGSTTTALTVNYAVSGSATAGADYAQLAGTVTIPAAAIGAYADLTPVNDTDVEGTETVVVTLLPDTAQPATYGIEVPSATMSIADNDTGFSTSVGFSTSSIVKQENAGAFTVDVTRTGTASTAFSVEYGVLAGTALGNGVDYLCPAGRLDFASGEMVKSIPITIIDDNIAEDLETLTLTLRNATGAAITGTATQYTCLIVDNEPRVTITASDAVAYEGTKTAQFTVRRYGRTAGALVVPITVGGTASSGVDFTALPASVTIPDAAATATLTLTSLADGAVEAVETVVVSLAASSNSLPAAQASATVFIGDAQSDNPPFIQVVSPKTATSAIPSGAGLSIDTSVVDDGAAASLTTAWSKVSGPGTVTFSAASQPDTDATFSAAGAYVLRLTAGDGTNTTTSDLTVLAGAAILPWTNTDIGTVALPGSGTEQNGLHAVNGTGSTLTSTADSFFLRSRRLNGDGEIIARVRYVPNTSTTARVGVMLRESTAANARYESMLLAPVFANLDSRNTRSTAGATAAASTFSGATPAWWVRVVRSGNSFSSYDSPDGATWTQRGTTTTIAMPTDVLAGLAVMSANTARLNTALIDNVRIIGTPDNTGPGVAVSAPASVPVNTTCALDGTITEDALPSLTAATTLQWTQRSGPATVTFADATASDTTTVLPAAGTYVLRLTADDGEVRTFADATVSAIADTVPPSVTVVPTGTFTKNAPIDFNFTFSEPVVNFTAAGISVTNGTKGTLTGSGAAWSIPVTPTANGAVTCAVVANAAQDGAGNPNTASTTASVTYDTVPPSIGIGAPSLSATKAGPVNFTVTYSDTNFSAATLAAANIPLNKTGTANGVVGVSGTGASRTVTVSSITGTGTLGLSIAAGTATDLAGNSAGAAGPSATFSVDNTPPVLSPVSISSTNVNPAYARAGNTITVSFQSNEPLQSPAVSIAGSAASVSGGGTAWSASLTTSAGAPQGVAAFSISAQDVLGNAATAVTATSDASQVKIDTAPPVLTLPPMQTAEASSAAGASVPYPNATASDASPTTIGYSQLSGSAFTLGTTPVLVTATDAAGNSSTGSFDVLVQDTTAPMVTGPADRTVEAASASGAVVNFTPTATDAVGVASIMASPASGSTFGIGATNVTVTAKDAANNEGTGTFKITVRDTTAPVLSAPAGGFTPLTLATGLGGTVPLPDYAAQAQVADAVGLEGTVTQTPAPNSPQPVGMVRVILTARDAAGNVGTLEFDSTITDGTAPVLSGPLGGFTPTNIATGAAGTAILPDYLAQASATDNVAVEGLITQTPAPGGAYPVGTVNVTLEAADAAGNIGKLTFAVNMNDGTLPVFTTTPQDRTISAGASGTGIAPDLLPEVVATDNVAVTGMTQLPAAAAVLPLGPNDITITLSDAAGNTAQAIVHVTVTDRTQPVVSAPAGGFLPVSLSTAAGGVVALPDYAAQASASDNVAVVGAIAQAPAPGTMQTAGTVAVTLTAMDAAGNAGTLAFTVPVADGTAPVLTLPANVIAEATSAAGADVTFPVATATDEVTAAPVITYAPANGSTFALGTTTVQVTAKDEAGNTSTGSFTVRVRDTIAPVVMPIADIVAEASSPAGATVLPFVEVTDAVTANPTITLTPNLNALYPIGETMVTAHAVDEAGNEGTATFKITVRDTTAPSVTGSFSPRMISTGPLPDYRGQASVTDAGGGVTITQNPPALSDVSPGVVTVTITATDGSNNTGSASFTVQVRPLAPASEVVYSQKSAPPAAGTAGGPPADAELTSFGLPAIDAEGRIAVAAQWSSVSAGKGSGVFAGPRLVAKAGDEPAGASPAKLQSFRDPVIDGGRVAFIAQLSGVPKASATAVLSDAPNGQLAVIARTGVPMAAAGGATFKSFSSVAVAGHGVAFLAQLSPGSGLPKTTAASDAGLWAADATHGLTPLLREGQVIDQKTIKTLVSFSVGNGSPGQGRGAFLQQGAVSSVQALAIFTDNTQAVLSIDFNGGLAMFSSSGAGAAGAPAMADAYFQSYAYPAFTGTGHLGFLATLGGTASGLSKANARGIFTMTTGGAFAPLVRTTETASGTGATFSLLKDPVLAADGALAFPASLASRGLRGPAASSLWWRPAGGSLRLLARGADEPAGLPGAQWKSFTSLAVAAGRGPIFAATLVPRKGNVTSANAIGVWAIDYTGAQRLLFRTGDSIGGKTVKSFTVLSAASGSQGVTRSFNDAGQIVWKATFTDKTTAIISTTIP